MKMEKRKFLRFSCFTLYFLPLYYFFPRMSLLFSQDVFVSELLFDNSLISLSFLFSLCLSFCHSPKRNGTKQLCTPSNPPQKKKKRKKRMIKFCRKYFSILYETGCLRRADFPSCGSWISNGEVLLGRTKHFQWIIQIELDVKASWFFFFFFF